MYSFVLSGDSFTVPGPRRTKKVAVRRRLHTFPLQKHRLRASLAADDTYGFALDDLCLRIDTGSRAIAQPVAHDLRQMAHEFVVVFQPVGLDSYDRTVVGDTD